MNELNKIKDELSTAAFNMTKAEAISKGLCICCKKKPEFYSYNGRKEYQISGLCEFCFDDICDLERCKNCGFCESWHKVKVNRGECNNFELLEIEEDEIDEANPMNWRGITNE